MKVVGLVSGGKDSLYNLIKCVEHGHTIVAIANLHPVLKGTGDEVQELDSFMFQTVGHTAVSAIAEALGVPLVRRSFDGKAKQTGVQYLNSGISSEDEIEDLFELLKSVQVWKSAYSVVGFVTRCSLAGIGARCSRCIKWCHIVQLSAPSGGECVRLCTHGSNTKPLTVAPPLAHAFLCVLQVFTPGTCGAVLPVATGSTKSSH